MKRVIVLSLALLVVVSAVALADGAGAFSAFKNGVGARALAMGGAFVAIADDATGAYWNPAGLAQLDDMRLAGMSTDVFGMGHTHQYVAGAATIANFGMGLSWERYAYSGQQNDATGTPNGTLNADASAISFGLATSVMDLGMAGVNVKYYMGSILTNQASGFGFDLGLLVKLGDMFAIGVSATDLGGSSIAWTSGATDTVSSLYKLGLGMTLVDGSLVLGTDVDFDGTDLGDVHIGVEFKVIEELGLRGGVVLTDNFQNYYFSAGAGINVAGLYVDAAYILNEGLGNTLVLSAEFSLGSLLGGEEPEPAPATE
jgi:hypothetical protein